MKEVEVKEVVITTIARAGKGVEGDPIRRVVQVWEKNGDLIAERDEFLLEKMDLLTASKSRLDDFEFNDDPETLAAFPRILTEGEYPSKKWYKEAREMLNTNFMNEPKGTRYEILAQTLAWVNKKIQSMP